MRSMYSVRKMTPSDSGLAGTGVESGGFKSGEESAEVERNPPARKASFGPPGLIKIERATAGRPLPPGPSGRPQMTGPKRILRKSLLSGLLDPLNNAVRQKRNLHAG